MVTADEVDVLDSSEDEVSSDEEPSSDLAQESIRPSVNTKEAAMYRRVSFFIFLNAVGRL